MQGMGCAACVARVQGTIRSQKGVSDCNVSLASNSAQVDYDPKVITAADIRKAVQDAGYDLIIVNDGESDEDAEDEADRLKGGLLSEPQGRCLRGHIPVPFDNVAWDGVQGFPFQGVCTFGADDSRAFLVRETFHRDSLEAGAPLQRRDGHSGGSFDSDFVLFQSVQSAFPSGVDFERVDSASLFRVVIDDRRFHPFGKGA